jgi:hypothetical protein
MLSGVTVQNLAGMTVSVVRVQSEANTGLGNPGPQFNTPRNNRRTVQTDGTNLSPNPTPGQFGPTQGMVGAVASGVIRIVEGAGLPQSGVGTTDQDDLRNERAREENEELREQVEQRQFTTPPDQSFDPNDPTR